MYLDHEPNVGADTPARIVRRRGGSAAAVAVAVVGAGGSARLICKAARDDRLVRELEAAGVEVFVQRCDRTGSIVVLVDDSGERTMLTDREPLDPVDPS